jgi:hypothetical protein
MQRARTGALPPDIAPSRPDGGQGEIKPVMETDLRINGGCFLFRCEAFG